MNGQLKKIISRRMRWLVHLKRYWVALKHHRRACQESYSQYGEDKWLQESLSDYDLNTGMYLDVGANQPSHLSNSYLFYKNGLKGILVEPDQSNVRLLHQFRSRDIIARCLVGEKPELVKFNYSVYSVLNSVKDLPAESILKVEYEPQLRVDDLMRSIDASWIYFISVDTEGYDIQVLKGAVETLSRTLFVCAEFHGDNELEALVSLMNEREFELVSQNKLNLFFRNTNLQLFDQYKKADG